MQPLPVKDAMLALIPACARSRSLFAATLYALTTWCRKRSLKPGRTLTRFEQGTNLRAWLFTILRNTYFSELRKRRREVEDVDGKKTASLSVVPAQQGHLDMQDLREALKLLPADQRDALVLVRAAGMSYEEAAEVAQCAVGTIKSWLNRARTKLSALLGFD